MRKSKTTTIRDFIYVDVDRLYSLYSQVFEGVAEQIFQSYIDSLISKDKQKGFPLLGNSAEEEVTEVSRRTENKILYDHMYNQLEAKLQDSLLEIRDNISLENYDKILSETFMIKVYGNAEIEDYERVRVFAEKLNSLAEAIAYAGTISEVGKSTISTLEFLLNSKTISNSEKASARAQLKKLKDPKQLAIEMGLSQDEKMLGYLKEFIDMFYREGFEITVIPNQGIDDIVFRGVINKNWLRLTPDFLRALYGGFVKSNWTLVGQVTFMPGQVSKPKNVEQSSSSKSIEENDAQPSLRDPFRKIFDGMSVFESMFLESQPRVEVLVYPLAIYREVPINIRESET